MKKIVPVLLIMLFLFQSLTVSAVGAEDPAQSAGCHSLDAAAAILGTEPLIENCRSALVYETKTQTLLYAQNADEHQFPSSIVKIVTALICVEQAELTDTATASQAALDTVPASALVVDIQAGEVLTIQDLLYCLLVGSGNDAAAVLAEHIAGSQLKFVDMMNERVRQMGCTDTNFVNVHGLHNEQQYTTARDVARILSAAIENEVFTTVFSAVYYTVPATNLSDVRYLVTNNFMVHKEESDLYYDTRVKGGRTGVTEIGERNIAVWAEHEDMCIVSVVLGAVSQTAADGYSISRYGGYYETTALLDAVFGGYKRAQVLYENQAVCQYEVQEGDCKVAVGPKVNVSTVLPESAKVDDLDFRYTNTSGTLHSPISKGDKICAVQIWYDTICVGQADLYALNAVQDQQTVTITSSHETQQGISAWVIVLLILAVVAAVILVVRYGNFGQSGKSRNTQARPNGTRRRSR